MKLHRILAKAAGYEMTKYSKHPSSRSHMINLINHYEIDLVLDVGANVGQFGKILRQEGYKGEIHSFEPASTSYKLLKEASQKDDQWFIHKRAMAEQKGELELNLAESSDLSSFLPANDFGKAKYKKIVACTTETVDVSTISHFLKNNINDYQKRRIFLKMDTQGYDLKVFTGALDVIDCIDFILSEISFIPIYDGMPRYLETLQTYEQYNFIISGLYPISRKKDLSVVEMDCMMLNKSRLIPDIIT
jgi:FkbM family methyltransferase